MCAPREQYNPETHGHDSESQPAAAAAEEPVDNVPAHFSPLNFRVAAGPESMPVPRIALELGFDQVAAGERHCAGPPALELRPR